ncbi:septal ring lytic transglycosylase RlpA family protein [Sphingorhabdus arenilitoris]|uniref:Endolytic peptidoglycan transglycosylase RlpA n=1 Tax=Sphingorhabdus arenilitoris TaxID=1490041 RepID=A0ABV8RI15_9SPHN
MKYASKVIILSAAAAALSSCGGRGGLTDVATPPQSASAQQGTVSDYPQKLGEPYQIDGKSYTPEDVASYDDVGYASYYGRELAGRPTANGEPFNPAGITAAHKTLPLASYVEVTALDTGKTILVRVNDRGPFANDRLIDLSEGAARELGILEQGVAGVRVRKVNPPEQERAALRGGLSAPARIATPESLLKVLRGNLAKLPKPAPVSQASRAVPVIASTSNTAPAARDGRFIREGSRPSAAPTRQAAPVRSADGRFVREGAGTPQSVSPSVTGSSGAGSSGSYVVQVASFSSRPRADALARKLGATVMASADGNLFRVRYGPYASETEAENGLATARKRGYSDAKIFRE